MVDLTDFGAGAEAVPPLLMRKNIIRPPLDDGKIAGFVCKELERDTNPVVYSTLRGKKHYYREGGGYAISDAILARIENIGVSRIFVHTGVERGDVYEFRASDYYQSEKQVHEKDLEDPRDPQTYIKKDEAMHVWDGHAPDLFYRTFSAALDHIDNRRYL